MKRHFFEGFQASLASPSDEISIKTKMSVDYMWNGTHREELKHSEKIQPNRHFFQQANHVKWLNYVKQIYFLFHTERTPPPLHKH